MSERKKIDRVQKHGEFTHRLYDTNVLKLAFLRIAYLHRANVLHARSRRRFLRHTSRTQVRVFTMVNNREVYEVRTHQCLSQGKHSLVTTPMPTTSCSFPQISATRVDHSAARPLNMPSKNLGGGQEFGNDDSQAGDLESQALRAPH